MYDEQELTKFVEKFEKEGYKVKQIELWVEAIAGAEGVTNLFINLEGKAACKITLEPWKK